MRDEWGTRMGDRSCNWLFAVRVSTIVRAAFSAARRVSLLQVQQVTRAALCSVVAAVAFVSSATSQQFALKDNSTVAFYGDSITAQHFYTRFVEEFVLTRYPALNIHFVNAGVPGDTVFGGYAGTMAQRVQRDVAPVRPDMITVMLGMNDGGWGYTPAAAMHANFIKGYNDLLDSLHKIAPGAAFTLIAPSPYDEITHGTEFPGYAGLVAQLAADVPQIANARQTQSGEQVLLADFQKPLADALSCARTRSPELAPLMIPDRIHPGEVTHWIMAAALMRAWHVDPVVSSVTLDAGTGKATEVLRTTITELMKTESGLRWSQLDQALPLPLDLNHAMTGLLLQCSTIADVDRQQLQVRGLAAGRYQLRIDDKAAAIFTNAELAKGVNLAILKTPMLEDARGVDWMEERRALLDQAALVLTADVKASDETEPTKRHLHAAETQLADAVRSKLQPKPHRFELKKQ